MVTVVSYVFDLLFTSATYRRCDCEIGGSDQPWLRAVLWGCGGYQCRAASVHALNPFERQGVKWSEDECMIVNCFQLEEGGRGVSVLPFIFGA